MSNRKNNLAVLNRTIDKEAERREVQRSKDLMQNPRVSRASLEPMEAFIVVEMDPIKERTDSGILMPDGTHAHVFSDAAPKEAKQFRFDTTALVILCGPDVENVKVGDRVLLPFPPVQCPTTDARPGRPLAMLDSRDILCKLKES